MELIRSLIEKIVLTPKEGGGVDALLHGALARILVLCSEQQKAPEADAVRGFSLWWFFSLWWLRGQDLNL